MENQDFQGKSIEQKIKIAYAIGESIKLKINNIPKSETNNPEYSELIHHQKDIQDILMKITMLNCEAQSEKLDVDQLSSIQKCLKDMLNQYYHRYSLQKGRVNGNVEVQGKVVQGPEQGKQRWSCVSKHWQKQLIKHFYKLDIYDDSGFGHRLGYCGQVKDNKRTYCCESCSKIFKNYLGDLK